jgi:hypothetical protein
MLAESRLGFKHWFKKYVENKWSEVKANACIYTVTESTIPTSAIKM